MSGSERLRVEVPAWLDGESDLRPRDVRFRSGRFEFLYLEKDGWIRVVVAPSEMGRWDVHPGTGGHEHAARLHQALGEDPRWMVWLDKVRTRRDMMPAIGVSDPVVALLSAVSRGAEPTRSEVESALASASSLPEPALTLARVVLWLAAGQPLSSLDAWSELTETTPCFTTDLVGVLIDHLAGRYTSVIARTERIGRSFRDSEDARAAGEAAHGTGDSRAAALLRSTAALDWVGEPSRYFSFMEIALAAARDSKSRDVAAMLAGELQQRAHEPHHQLLVADAQSVAGNFSGAESTLRPLLGAPAVAREAALQLAQIRLWSDDAAEAERLVAGWADSDLESAVVLAAAEGMQGRVEPALRRLEGILSKDPENALARIWRGRLLNELTSRLSLPRKVWRTLRELVTGTPLTAAISRKDLIEARAGDSVGRELWRGLTGGTNYLMGHQTGFIVRANVRLVMGEDCPWPDTAPEARALVRKAARKLGGNMSSTATVLDDAGKLDWLDATTARKRSEQLVFSITRRPVSEVLEEFQRLAATEPTVPFYRTYAAELWMWKGDYERSHDLFLQVWNETRTRWGYVGAGATAHLLGNYDRALELWDDGAQDWEWLDGEATYCYRGELRRIRGDTVGARADLMVSLGAQPLRVGARVNLALVELDEGNLDAARTEVETIESHMPAYAWIARNTVDSTLRPGEHLRAYMESLLALMRGNRSSNVYTMVDPSGEFRVTPVRDATEVSRSLAARVAGVVAGDLQTVSLS